MKRLFLIIGMFVLLQGCSTTKPSTKETNPMKLENTFYKTISCVVVPGMPFCLMQK
jgi:PBP1b-binding outer membrane lipoprotein LpoB